MRRLYRMHCWLPSPTMTGPAVAALAILLGACDAEPPPRQSAKPISNQYLEALQEAEAVKHSLEQRNLEQQRIDDLIGAGRAQPPTR